MRVNICHIKIERGGGSFGALPSLWLRRCVSGGTITRVKLWHSGEITQFYLDIVLVFMVSVGQKFGDISKSRKIAVSLPVTADSVIRIAQIIVDEITTKRIGTVRRKSIRRRV